MQPLIKYNREIESGLQPDRGEEKIEFWEDGENIIFQEGAVQPAPGQFLWVPKPQGDALIGLEDARFSDGTRNICMGYLDKLYLWTEGDATATDVSRLVGGAYAGVADATTTAEATQWSIVARGNEIYATNYIDEPQVLLSGAANFVDLDTVSDLAANYRCAIFGKIGPFLFAFRTAAGATINDFTIDWCSSDDPTVWTPATTNSAGQLEARDLGSPIICAKPYADGYAVYGLDECRYVYPVPAPDYLGIRPLLSGIGAVSKHSVVPVDRIQYGMGTRGIWMHDGSQSNYIDTPDVHDSIYGDLNQTQVTKCVAVYDGIEHLVLFFWPSRYSTVINKCVAYNTRNKTWTKLGYARTAYCRGSVWEAALTGSNGGDVWMHAGVGFAPTGEGEPLVLDSERSLLILPGFGGMGFGMGYFGSIKVGED